MSFPFDENNSFFIIELLAYFKISISRTSYFKKKKFFGLGITFFHSSYSQKGHLIAREAIGISYPTNTIVLANWRNDSSYGIYLNLNDRWSFDVQLICLAPVEKTSLNIASLCQSYSNDPGLDDYFL